MLCEIVKQHNFIDSLFKSKLSAEKPMLHIISYILKLNIIIIYDFKLSVVNQFQ